MPLSQSEQSALVVVHLGIARTVAAMLVRKVPRGRPYLKDLVGDAYLGLVVAARKYDPTLGASFASYGFKWARAMAGQALRRYLHSSYRPEFVEAAPDGQEEITDTLPSGDDGPELSYERAETGRMVREALQLLELRIGTKKAAIFYRRLALQEPAQAIAADLQVSTQYVDKVVLAARPDFVHCLGRTGFEAPCAPILPKQPARLSQETRAAIRNAYASEEGDQRELAERFGISQQHVSRLVRRTPKTAQTADRRKRAPSLTD